MTSSCLALLATEASLPYPRGLWPLNSHYGLKDITGRAGDFQAPPGQGQVATFEDSGPLGDQRGKADDLSIWYKSEY